VLWGLASKIEIETKTAAARMSVVSPARMVVVPIAAVVGATIVIIVVV